MPTPLPQQRAAAALQLGMVFGGSPNGVGLVAVLTLVRTSAFGCQWREKSLPMMALLRGSKAEVMLRRTPGGTQRRPAPAAKREEEIRGLQFTRALTELSYHVSMAYVCAMAVWTPISVEVQLTDHTTRRDHLLPRSLIGATDPVDEEGSVTMKRMRPADTKTPMDGASVAVARTRLGRNEVMVVI
jgi:hypothetical protein